MTLEINFIALFILIKELQNTFPEDSKMAAEDLLLEGLWYIKTKGVSALISISSIFIFSYLFVSTCAAVCLQSYSRIYEVIYASK